MLTRTVAHRQIDDAVCRQAGYTESVIPDGVIVLQIRTVAHGQIADTVRMQARYPVRSYLMG